MSNSEFSDTSWSINAMNVNANRETSDDNDNNNNSNDDFTNSPDQLDSFLPELVAESRLPHRPSFPHLPVSRMPIPPSTIRIANSNSNMLSNHPIVFDTDDGAETEESTTAEGIPLFTIATSSNLEATQTLNEPNRERSNSMTTNDDDDEEEEEEEYGEEGSPFNSSNSTPTELELQIPTTGGHQHRQLLSLEQQEPRTRELPNPAYRPWRLSTSEIQTNPRRSYTGYLNPSSHDRIHHQSVADRVRHASVFSRIGSTQHRHSSHAFNEVTPHQFLFPAALSNFSSRHREQRRARTREELQLWLENVEQKEEEEVFFEIAGSEEDELIKGVNKGAESIDWRVNCKRVTERLKYIFMNDQFQDVVFYIGPSALLSRSNSVFSSGTTQQNQPSQWGILNRSTSVNEHSQRYLSSVIAQASGQISHQLLSPSKPSSEIDDVNEYDDDKTERNSMNQGDAGTAEARARRLTDLLLSIEVEKDTLDTQQVSTNICRNASSSSSPNSSEEDEEEECDGGMDNISGNLDTSDVDMPHTSTKDSHVVKEVNSFTQTLTKVFQDKNPPTKTFNQLRKDEVISTNPRLDSPDSTSQPDEVGSKMPEIVKQFGAHRLVLAMASPVFEVMFYGAFAESSVSQSNRDHVDSSVGKTLEIFLHDVTSEAFKQCLRFMYYDDMQLSEDIDTLYDLLYAAKKYLLGPLASACSARLVALMSPQNVLLQLGRASAISEDELVRICWHTIDVLTPEVLASDQFVLLEKETLIDLIRRETLCCEEWMIFEGVLRWVTVECSRREIPHDMSTTIAPIMSDFLPHIRFTNMALEDFVLHVSKTSILSLEVQHNMLMSIATRMFQETDIKCSRKKERSAKNRDEDGRVSSTKREGEQVGEEAEEEAAMGIANTLNRHHRTGPVVFRCPRFTSSTLPMFKEGFWSDLEAIIFSVSTSIFLAGVGVYGPVNIDTNLKVTVELKRCSLRPSFHGTNINPISKASIYLNPRNEGHRHRHSVGTQSSLLYRRVPSGNSFYANPPMSSSAFRFASVGTGGGRRGGSQGGPGDLMKMVLGRGGGSVLASAQANITCKSDNRIAEIKFPKPIKLTAGKSYVLFLKPETERITRCWMGNSQLLPEIAVRTKSKQTSVNYDWFTSPVPSQVQFSFTYNVKSRLNCTYEGFHLHQLLFYPAS